MIARSAINASAERLIVLSLRDKTNDLKNNYSLQAINEKINLIEKNQKTRYCQNEMNYDILYLIIYLFI